ncbi:MAG: BrnA antitoxin family protein [Proteobacteria bacterium]|nr:BrnA antitoxin family protein [Pseudomonadota bacterium]
MRLGRPKSKSRNVLMSVRYSPEVVEYFRATGDGWQARMDEVLKEWVKAHLIS